MGKEQAPTVAADPLATPLDSFLQQSAASAGTPQAPTVASGPVATPVPQGPPETQDLGYCLLLPNGRIVNQVNHATHTKSVKLTEKGPLEIETPRQYRAYKVTPTGKAASDAGLKERIIEHCVDESDAKSIYFRVYGVGDDPSRFGVKVSLA